MTELANEESVIAKPSNRFEMSKEANDLRRKREFEKALPLYRELSKDDSDSYSAAGLLRCLRELRLFDQALPLCIPTNRKHLALDWYRNEVIWTLIQGKLQELDESATVDEVVSAAELIFALEPKGTVAKWNIVRRVLKVAKLRNRWDIVSKWIERVNPGDLSTTPMKDDRGREGWCEQAVWHNFRIRSEIEVGDKQQAIVAAQHAIGLFPQQAKFFKRLEALANFRLGRLVEAELLYGKLSNGGRTDWWILNEHAHVLQELGKHQEALVLMCKAALSSKKLELLVSLFSDIGFLCHKTELKQDAKNHLVLCKYIREEQGWSIPQAVSSVIAELDGELSNLAGPAGRDGALAECQKFWRRTVGAEHDSREPSLRSREVKRMLKGKLKMGPPERPYCFLLSDTRESYFCRKTDLPDGAIDGVTLKFDAMPSFDRKKNQESWKAINVQAM
jgi:tetratricopeptide (TPR) repeat protein